MCLPFCCREENDPPGQGDQPHTAGKEANNGKGADINKSGEDGKMAYPSPIRAPPPSENLVDQKGVGKMMQGREEHRDTEEVPSPTLEALQSPSPKPRGQKITEASVAARTTPEHTFSAFPTATNKAPKKVEQVVATSNHHAGPVAAAGVADSARTPPKTQQIAHRGHGEDDYGYPTPSASPTVVAVPAANNFHGDRVHAGDGHAHAHADAGKDDPKTQGRTWW